MDWKGLWIVAAGPARHKRGRAEGSGEADQGGVKGFRLETALPVACVFWRALAVIYDQRGDPGLERLNSVDLGFRRIEHPAGHFESLSLLVSAFSLVLITEGNGGFPKGCPDHFLGLVQEGLGGGLQGWVGLRGCRQINSPV